MLGRLHELLPALKKDQLFILYKFLKYLNFSDILLQTRGCSYTDCQNGKGLRGAKFFYQNSKLRSAEG